MADENTVGGVNVEVTADLTKYSAGLAEAQRQAQAFDTATQRTMAGASSAVGALTIRQQALVTHLIAVNATMAQAEKIIGSTATAQKVLAAFGAQLAASQANVAASAIVEAGAEEILSKAVKDEGNAEVERTVKTKAAGLAFNQNRVIVEALAAAHEIMQGRTSRLGGTLAIMAQAAGLFSASMIGVTLTVGGVIAAVGGATLAMLAFEESQRKLAISTLGVGAASGVTYDQLSRLASEGMPRVSFSSADAAQALTTFSQTGLDAAVSTGALQRAMSITTAGNFKMSIQDAEKAEMSFSAAGVRSAATIGMLKDSLADYAALTGEKNKDATKELAAAMHDLADGTAEPTKGIDEMNAKLGFLNGTQLNEIRTLALTGNSMAAQAEATKLLHDRTEEASGVMGGLQNQFQNIWAAAGDATRAIGQFTEALSHSPPSPQWLSDIERRMHLIQQHAQDATDSAKGETIVEQTPEGREQTEYERLRGQETVLRRSMAATRRQGGPGATEELARQQHAVDQIHDAWSRVTDASGHYVTQIEREHQIVQAQTAQAEAKAKHDKAGVEAAKERVTYLQAGMEVETNAQARQHAEDEGARAAALTHVPKGPKATFGAKERSVVEDTEDELKLAEAYGVSSEAAIKAEATRKALTDATLHSRTATQAALEVQNQINLQVAKDVADLAKQTSAMEIETAAQNKASDAIIAGTMSAKDADLARKKSVQSAQDMAAADMATGHAKDVATAAIARNSAALDANSAAADRAAAAASIDKSRDATDIMDLKLRMVGQPKSVSEPTIARAEKAQELGVGEGDKATPEQAQAIDLAGQEAVKKAQLEGATSMRAMTEEVTKQTQAFAKQSDTLGMTHEAAAKYEEMQKLLDQAQKDGIELTDQERAALEKLADAYGDASEKARLLKESQKAATDASNDLTKSFTQGLEAIIFDGKKASDVFRDMEKNIGKQIFEGVLSGQGPFAGILGTNKTDTEGGPNKGLLSQLFGGLFGVGENKDGRMKPTGAKGDPIYTIGEEAGHGIRSGTSWLDHLLHPNQGPSVNQLIGEASTRSLAIPSGATGPTVSDLVGEAPGYASGTDVGGNPTVSDLVGMAPSYASGTDVSGGAGGPNLTSMMGGGSGPMGGIGGAAGGIPGAPALLSGALGIASMFTKPSGPTSAPDGSESNPLYVKMAGQGGSGGGQGGGIMSMLQGLMGGGGAGGDAAAAGGGGDFLAGIMHTGGQVGTPTRMVSDPPRLWSKAPRLHSGLAPDEFRAILQHGETVIPKGGSRGASSKTVNMHIHGVSDAGSFQKTSRQIDRQTKRSMATL